MVNLDTNKPVVERGANTNSEELRIRQGREFE